MSEPRIIDFSTIDQSQGRAMVEMARADICGKIKKNGTPCLARAGAGTDHSGIGFCKPHDVSRVRVHGKYSKQVSKNAVDLYMEMLEDPELESLNDEIAILRSTIGDIEEMIDEVRERNDGKLLPVASEGLKGMDANDQKAVLKLISQKESIAKSIASILERKSRLEAGHMVSYKQVQEVLAQVLYVIKKNCEGCNRLERLAEEFQQIDLTQE